MELAGVVSGIVGTVVASLTLVVLVLRGVFTLERRLSRLEIQMEPFWDALRHYVAATLLNIRPGGNPIAVERWQGLLRKLQANSLSLSEARELEKALLEQQEEARTKNDSTALLALGLGLALVAVVLKQKRAA